MEENLKYLNIQSKITNLYDDEDIKLRNKIFYSL